MTNTYAPSFINGSSKFVAVGGYTGEGVEIWSVADKEMVHHIDECREDNAFVSCSYSANGILAVGYVSIQDMGYSKYLKLYDVSTWTMIYRHDFASVSPRHLFLTE